MTESESYYVQRVLVKNSLYNNIYSMFLSIKSNQSETHHNITHHNTE